MKVKNLVEVYFMKGINKIFTWIIIKMFHMIGILISELFCGGFQKYSDAFSESDILFILNNQDAFSGCFGPNLGLIYIFIWILNSFAI